MFGLTASMIATAPPTSGSLVGTFPIATAGWVRLGIPLAPNVATQHLQLGALVTQTDVLSRHAGGSIKFAVVTAKVVTPGTYQLRTTSSGAGAAFFPAWPTLTVSLTIEPSSPSGTPGTVYVATLPAHSASYASWRSGSLVVERRVRLTPLAGSTPHPFLRIDVDLASYADGTHQASVIGVNTLCRNSQIDRVDYALSITLNGSTVYTRATTTGAGTLTCPTSQNGATSAPHGLVNGDLVRVTAGPAIGLENMVWAQEDSSSTALRFTQVWTTLPTNAPWQRVAVAHWSASRWIKRFATAGFVEATLAYDTEVLYASKAVPRYRSDLVLNGTQLDPTWYEPMQTGAYHFPISDGGLYRNMGPVPNWTAMFLAHPSSQLLRTTVLHEADIAGTIPIHWGDSDSEELISLTNFPTWDANGNDFPQKVGSSAFFCRGAGVNAAGTLNYFQQNNYHITDNWHVPFLITGERYYWEEKRFWANYSLLTTYNQGPVPSAQSRGEATGWLGVANNSARGLAWGLRSLFDTAYWAPDTDPYRTYFHTIAQNNLTVADSYWTTYAGNGWGASAPRMFDQWAPRNAPADPNIYPSHFMENYWADSWCVFYFDRGISDYGFSGGTIARNALAQQILDLYNATNSNQRAPYWFPVAYYKFAITTVEASPAPTTTSCTLASLTGDLQIGDDVSLYRAGVFYTRTLTAKSGLNIGWSDPLPTAQTVGEYVYPVQVNFPTIADAVARLDQYIIDLYSSRCDVWHGNAGTLPTCTLTYSTYYGADIVMGLLVGQRIGLAGASAAIDWFYATEEGGKSLLASLRDTKQQFAFERTAW